MSDEFKATEQHRADIAALVEHVAWWIDETWEVDARCESWRAPASSLAPQGGGPVHVYQPNLYPEALEDEPLEPFFRASVHRLVESFGHDVATRRLAAAAAFSGEVDHAFAAKPRRRPELAHVRGRILWAMGQAWSFRHAVADDAQLVLDSWRESLRSTTRTESLGTTHSLARMLVRGHRMPGAADLALDVLVGSVFALDPSNPNGSSRHPFRRVARELVLVLHRAGRLSVEVVESGARIDHGLLAVRTPATPYRGSVYLEPDWPECVEALRPLAAEAALRMLDRLDDGDVQVLLQSPPFHGMEALTRALEHVDRLDIRKVAAKLTGEAGALRVVLENLVLPRSDLDRLRAGFPTWVLEAAIAAGSQDVRRAVLHALGRDSEIPLLGWLHETQALAPESAVDLPAAIRITEEAGDDAARRLAGQLRQGRMDRALEMLAAIRGWSGDEVARSLVKRKQDALRAFGLLPLSRGTDEVLERYLFFQEFLRRGKEVGAERAENERIAVQVGLEHLAQVAGFDDSSRLEWAMEARLGKQAESLDPVLVGEHEVRVEGHVPEARLVAFKGGRALKSLPPALKKAPEVVRLREALSRLEEQAARARSSVERVMVEGRTLARADIDALLALPSGSRLLSGVVLLAEAGHLGLLDPASGELVDLLGRRHPLPGTVAVVHPIELGALGQLEAWQRHVASRGIAQPFRQIFRETYRPLADEDLAQSGTRRFAGMSVRSSQAGRLLQSRQWLVRSGEEPEISRELRAHRLRVRLEVVDAGHYLGETATCVLGGLSFHARSDGAGVPLRDVPPHVLSEALRDVDLVASVAAAGDGPPRVSPEQARRRGELARALLAALGVTNVRLDGRGLVVESSAGPRRVDLGTAAIFEESGRIPVEVPARWGAPGEDVPALLFDDEDGTLRLAVGRALKLARE